MRIFISGTAGFGSSAVTELPLEVQKYLCDIMKQDNEILVGDCFGTDYLVQKFLADAGYSKVTVYASGDKARNCLGNWPIKYVQAPHCITGREFYAQKDKTMQQECDMALAIWDGKSRGTGANIENTIALGKLVLVWNTVKGSWFSSK